MLRNLAAAHLFEDGNKRTAYAVTEAFLRQTNNEVAPSIEQAEVVMRHFKRFSVHHLANWLETAEIDESKLRVEYPE